MLPATPSTNANCSSFAHLTLPPRFRVLRRRLTDASIARTVASVATEGVLCTSLAGFSDITFPVSVGYLADKSGRIIAPLGSREAASNLAECKRVSFFAKAPRGGATAESVLTLVGEVESLSVDEDVSDADLKDVSTRTGKTSEELAALPWVRLAPERVHVFDAVRGVEAWVSAGDYAEAEPNPLAPAAQALLEKLNTQHTAALRRFAAVFAGVPGDEVASAEVLSVDQMGFDLKLQLGPSAPPSLIRAGFKLPPANAEEGTSVFMKLFQEAYERENGFMQ